jgi:YVTN family beta-propeller protein
VIETASLTIKKRIKVGKHPYGIFVSASGKYIVSVNVKEDTVSIINTKTNQQKKLNVGYHPYCATMSLDEKTLFVTNTQDDSVSVLNIATQKTIATITVGSTPEGISLDEANQRAYIANWGSNNVSVIDTNSNKLLSNIKTGEKSRAFGQFILRR